MHSIDVRSPGGSEDDSLNTLEAKVIAVMRSRSMQPRDPVKKTFIKKHSHYPMICVECGTSDTPLWRKDIYSNTVCNACGIRGKRALTNAGKRKANAVVSPLPSQAVSEYLLKVVDEEWLMMRLMELDP